MNFIEEIWKPISLKIRTWFSLDVAKKKEKFDFCENFLIALSVSNSIDPYFMQKSGCFSKNSFK
jgi:hypothetical protein